MIIVGSLTTLPKRLLHIRKTLISIQNQNLLFDNVYLNIPYKTIKGEEYIIPSDLLLNFDRIIINRCDDQGSVTKLLPTLLLETDPETIIITFDDDMIYDKDLVKNLVGGIQKHKDSCIGTRGWIVGTFPFLYQSVSDQEKEVDWLEGKTGIAYKRKFFGNIPTMFTQQFMNKELNNVLKKYEDLMNKEFLNMMIIFLYILWQKLV